MRGIAFLLALVAAPAIAQTIVKVKAFPGVQALALMAAESQRLFERQGLEVQLVFTSTSQEQRDGLAKGEFEIAQSAVDNAVAMVEAAHEDVVIVSGGNSGMNEIIVQPDVRSYADLRGHTLVVDAPNTAYALQLKKILLMNGLKEGPDYKLVSVGSTGLRLRAMKENKDYKATMLNLPFFLDAKAAGLKSLGRAVDVTGPYQANGTFVLRRWALANRETLERYLAGLIGGTRWALAPENKDAVVKLLVARLKISPEIAATSWELMREPNFGITPDARFDMVGFRKVLGLRAEMEGSWGGRAPSPERYVDLSYYENALKRLERP